MVQNLKTVRKLHLWLGLFMSIFILIEAVTGLLLAEPSLMGVNRTAPINVEDKQPISVEQNNQQTIRERKNPERHGDQIGQENNFFGFVKQLHSGRVGEYSIKWLVDIVAVSLIILTLTGIYLFIAR